MESNDNLFNYMNLNFFCNRLGIQLSNFKRTGSKSEDLNSLSKTLRELLDKYLHWSPVPKYKSIVDDLLNSEDENYLLTQVLENMSGREVSKPSELEETINQISQNLTKIEESSKITQSTKSSIDYLTKFLINLSNYTLIAQDGSLISSRKEAVFVSLK